MANVVKKAVSVPANLLNRNKEGMVKVYQSSERALSNSPSAESLDLDNAGARLEELSLTNIERKSPTAGAGTEKATVSRLSEGMPSQGRGSFQLGQHPDGDVFLSPAKVAKDGTEKPKQSISIKSPSLSLITPKKSLDMKAGEAPSHNLRSRTSNLSGRHHVGDVDAQDVYPPSACVFVANLPQPKDDQALEAAVTREFRKFGTVFVKIRRDIHQMPFAFCQFTKDEDADAALNQGRGIMILGRACRTEMVKANRTFVIYKRRNGVKITLEEARELMLEFGALNRCEHLRPELATQLQLTPGAVVVEYAMFDADRDVIKAFRHDPTYRVDALDLKRTDMSGHNGQNKHDEEYLRRYELDRRSVFVGNLSEDVTQEDIAALFSQVGEVHSVQLIKRSATQGMRVFGFVEYLRPDLPEQAVQTLNNAILGGSAIKVERKMPREELRTPRRVKSQILPRWTSPAGNNQFAGTPSTPTFQSPAQKLREDVVEPLQDGPGSASQSWSWVYGMQPVIGSAYSYSPAGPYAGQINNPQTIATPQGTPGPVNPYAYYGGFWPGMSYVQDPSWAYQGYTTPTHVSQPARSPNSNNHLATPTHASGSPSEHRSYSRH